ncbi:hypothetical protein LCGC14_2351200, partial [marine sediment metagenome]
MKHQIEIDGQMRDIEIKAMDESFIVYRKMYKAPLTPENIGKINPWDYREHLEEFKAKGWQKVIEDFFRKQIQIVGSCMILAWEGDGVIGKMHFTTKEMHEAFGGRADYWEAPYCYCVDHKGFAPKIQTFSDEELDGFLRPQSRILRILCFNIGHSD